jgi:hypothetical protein
VNVAVTIALPPKTVELLARAPAWPRALTAQLIKTLDRENEITVGAIQAKRLTGTGPFPVSEGRLGVVTNRLRSSLRPTAATALSGGAIVSAIGTNVRYGVAHEFGFAGTVDRKAHTRRRFTTNQVGGNAFLDPRTGRIRKTRKKLERVQTGSVQVKAHQLRVHIPERAPIRRGIADRLPAYGPALGRAVVAAFAAPRD